MTFIMKIKLWMNTPATINNDVTTTTDIDIALVTTVFVCFPC